MFRVRPWWIPTTLSISAINAVRLSWVATTFVNAIVFDYSGRKIERLTLPSCLVRAILKCVK